MTKEQHKEYRLKNRDRLLKYRKEWRQKNRKKILVQERENYKKNVEKFRKSSREHYRSNKQRELDRIRFKKYGITGDEFRAIIEKQGVKCPICTRRISKNLSVDHDHVTGRIRGIICNKCNLAIGNAEDSPMRLRAMADYLEKNG